MLKESKQKINFIRSLACLIFDLLSTAAFTLQWQSSCNKDPLQRLKYLVPAPAVNKKSAFSFSNGMPSNSHFTEN